MNNIKFTSIPKYKIDLDLPEEDRWTSLVQQYKPQFENIIKYIETILGSWTQYIASYILEMSINKVYYSKELISISKNSGIKLGNIILLQLCYEAFACCTSLIINNNGVPIHVRTMDWDMPELKELTVQIDFIKNRKVLYRAITWVGYVGIFTALKPNVCTLSLNYRRTNEGISTNVRNLIIGSWPIGFLIRHVLETESSYEKIEQYLSQSKIVSPCYIILSGCKIGSGRIIVRSREGVDNTEIIGNNNMNYIVQTNIDNNGNKDNIENILWSKERLKAIYTKMKQYINRFDIHNYPNKIIEYFNVWPIINDETIYVSCMDLSKDEITTYNCMMNNTI